MKESKTDKETEHLDFGPLSTLIQYSKDFLDGVIDQENYNTQALLHITEMSVGDQDKYAEFMKELAKRLVGQTEATSIQFSHEDFDEPFDELLSNNIHRVINRMASLRTSQEMNAEPDNARDAVITICRAAAETMRMKE
jgi:hypothetical protein